MARGRLNFIGLDGRSGHHGGELPFGVGAARQEEGAAAGANGIDSRQTNLSVDGAMTLWLIRAGFRGEHEQKFFDEGKVYIVWDGLNVNLKALADRQALIQAMEQRYPDEKPKAALRCRRFHCHQARDTWRCSSAPPRRNTPLGVPRRLTLSPLTPPAHRPTVGAALGGGADLLDQKHPRAPPALSLRSRQAPEPRLQRGTHRGIQGSYGRSGPAQRAAVLLDRQRPAPRYAGSCAGSHP
jgi:hypothetical protein